MGDAIAKDTVQKVNPPLDEFPWQQTTHTQEFLAFPRPSSPWHDDETTYSSPENNSRNEKWEEVGGRERGRGGFPRGILNQFSWGYPYLITHHCWLLLL